VVLSVRFNAFFCRLTRGHDYNEVVGKLMSFGRHKLEGILRLEISGPSKNLLS